MSKKISRRAFLASCGASLLTLSSCGASQSSGDSSSTTLTPAAPTDVRVASLKGPTSIGLLQFMDEAKADSLQNSYEFTIAATPDEIVPKVISGDFDIALVPANAASVLYNKTKGGVEVLGINTLGVLSVVTGDAAVRSFDDLAGRTVYLTGKAATPEYVMNYLLAQADIADTVTLEFKSEPTEIVSALAADPSAVGVLPEPFKTAALAKNSSLGSPIDLTDVWDELAAGTGSKLLTGVTIARREFVDAHPEAVWEFLSGQAKSVNAVNDDPAGWSQAVVDAGIVDSATVAEKVIPGCHIVQISDEDMVDALSGFLKVLADADASSVGGALPGDDFYYVVQGA